MALEIVAYTETVAEALKERYREDPLGELQSWINIAQTREAMVTEVYGIRAVESRFGNPAPRTVADVACKAIRNIWVHEETHTRYLRALEFAAGTPNAFLTELFGRLQGAVTQAASRGRLLARLSIAVGVWAGTAPAFAREVGDMNLGDFCGFCHELESTAAMGYDRILALCDDVSDDPDVAYAYSLQADIAKIHRDETFHIEVFAALRRWLDADGATFSAADPLDRVRELHGIVDRVFGRDGDKRAHDPDAATPRVWISDGAMGALFSEYGLAVPAVAV